MRGVSVEGNGKVGQRRVWSDRQQRVSIIKKMPYRNLLFYKLNKMKKN